VNKYTLIILLLICVLSAQANAQTISGHTGTIAPGESIVISGSSFGSNGPNIVIFDDFSDESSGSPVDTIATVGDWYVVGGEIEAVTAKDGNMVCFLVNDQTASYPAYGNMRVEFDHTTEAFLSYDMILPGGENWPTGGGGPDALSSVNYKITWLYDGWYNGESTHGGTEGGSPSVTEVRGDNDNLVVPLSIGSYLPIASNDSPIGGWDTADRIYLSSFFQVGGARNRMAYYLVGGDPDLAGTNGYIWMQAMSDSLGQTTNDVTGRVFAPLDADDVDTFPRWNHWELPGLLDNSSGADDWPENGGQMLFDNIYLSTGDGAQARIELGDSSTYSACKNLDIFTVTSWAASSVTATARITDFGTGDTAYLFVVDADGNVSDGYEVTISGESESFSLSSAAVNDGVLSLSWTDDSATEWYVQAMINDTSSYSILATSNSVSFPVDTGTVDVKITSSSGPVAQGQASN